MTKQKFVAGYDLDKVYEEEEARLKAEREAAERQRREDELRQRLAARKLKRTVKAEPTPAAPPVIVPVSSSVVPYHGIEFEHPAYRKAGETDKALLTYNASLARLRAAGFERHARPQEVFGLLAAGLEGKLTLPEKAIYDDQFTSNSEWLSLAFERQGDTLITYLDPEGLEWKKNGYVKTRNFKHAGQRDFDISGKKSSQYHDLNQFTDDLVQFLYGRSFADLPKKMREGVGGAQLYLPLEKTTLPVGRSDFNDGYNVYGVNFNFGASRGVRGRASAPKK